MLSSIHPLGERGKHNRYLLTATSFFVGSLLGAATTGSLAGVVALGAGAVLSESTRIGLFALAAAVAAAAEFRGWKLPSWRRQVNEDWLTTYRGWVYGLGFGFQLGAGVLTIVTSAAVHLALVGAVLTGSWTGALVVMVVFGVVRGGSIFAAVRVVTPAALSTFHRALQRRAGGVRNASSAGLAALAVGVVIVQVG